MATEKRLIDANALIKKIDYYYNNSPFPHPGTPWRRGFEYCAELILKEPTVDAVEVVRCMDCKAYDKEVGYCEAIGITCGANDFCSYGEMIDMDGGVNG